MQRRFALLLSFLTLAGSVGLSATAASAQTFNRFGVPVYNAWQPGWDQYVFDRRHVILGMVVGFQPYRVQVQRRNGFVQGVDLKNGTVILPTGATPRPGEHVALIGYYSNGTFIVNRLLIRG